MAMQEVKIKHLSLQDGHVHIAALHQGGLAWPCPAWLLPGAAIQHRTGSQTPLDQTDAAASTSGTSAATSSESGVAQSSGSSSNYSSSSSSSSDDDYDYASFNPATISNASVLPTVVAHRAAADLLPAAVAHADKGTEKSSSRCAQATSDNVSWSHNGQPSSSEGADNDSSCSESYCDSRGKAESDNSNGMVDAQDEHCTDTQTAVQGNGSQQQTTFDQLDMLFSRKGAAGSMSTHLAALALLKHKPGPRMHSGAQSAGRKSQSSLLCKVPARLQAGKAGAKAGRGLTKQCVLAGEDGGQAIPKTEWVQMQNGGNPLYSNQKAGSASTGEC